MLSLRKTLATCARLLIARDEHTGRGGTRSKGQHRVIVHAHQLSWDAAGHPLMSVGGKYVDCLWPVEVDIGSMFGAWGCVQRFRSFTGASRE
jgi:hypothetical protein